MYVVDGRSYSRTVSTGIYDMTGNRNDKVSDIIIKNSNLSATSATFVNTYGVKLQNVLINDIPFK
jgi:uncharacterized protein YeeX (DUF496 family)